MGNRSKHYCLSELSSRKTGLSATSRRTCRKSDFARSAFTDTDSAAVIRRKSAAEGKNLFRLNVIVVVAHLVSNCSPKSLLFGLHWPVRSPLQHAATSLADLRNAGCADWSFDSATNLSFCTVNCAGVSRKSDTNCRRKIVIAFWSKTRRNASLLTRSLAELSARVCRQS